MSNGDWLECSELQLSGIVHGFGGRGGVQLAEGPLSTSNQLYQVEQVHGNRVLLLSQEMAPAAVRAMQADAIVSATAGQIVAVRTADCVPLLLLDLQRRSVAAVHAGWRGLVANVIAETVGSMVRHHGCRPANMVAAVGPCIGPCHFEVGEDVASHFAQLAGAIQRDGPTGPPRVDLPRAATLLLRQQGIGRIAHCAACTYCQADQYFSYRRDSRTTGRQLSFIGIDRAQA